MIGIYKITNQINNKIYIGQSRNIELRWKAHRSRPFQPNCEQYDTYLYKAIRKYGLQNFIFEVLEECSIEELNNKEIYWISYFNSNNPDFGYNNTSGGQFACTYSKLNEKEAIEIQNYLQYSEISQVELGEKYHITQKSISNINTGNTWYNPNLIYPLRKKSILKQNDSIKISKSYKNICPNCGGLKDIQASLCITCTNVQRRKVERPTREELKKMIREEPFTTIAKKYGVTDNAIRKWCDLEKLPRKKTDINNISDEDWELI